MKSLRPILFGAGCLSLLGAVALLAIPAAYTYFSAQIDSQNVEVTGTVLSMYANSNWDSDQHREVTYYCPTVQYTTVEGQTYTFDSINCSTPPAYKAGDPVQVVYPADAPQNGHVKSGVLRGLGLGTAWSVGALGICLGVLGVISFVGGIVVGRTKKESAVL